MTDGTDPVLTRRACWLAMLAACAAPAYAGRRARAATMSAPDVVVYCDSTLAPAMRAAGADFRRRTGVPVRVFAAPGPQSLALIAHGARNDVLATQTNWMDQGAAQGLVKPAMRIGGWRDPVVLAGKDATPLPALPSAAALAGLLSGARLGVIDPTHPGGADGEALAQRLAWKARLAGAIDGPGVAYLVRHGSAGLGLLPRTSALAAPALAVVVAVPDAAAPPVEYAAAASKNALSRNTAAFLAYLNTPDASAILRNAGLEVAP